MSRRHIEKSLAVLLLIAPASLFATEPIVVHNTDKPLWDSTHRIEFKENLRIGGDDDDSEVFGQIVFIAADSHGRIIVADLKQNQVRRYSGNGEFLGVIGRGGDGPGEYRNVWAIATDPKDHMYLAGQGRISIFDKDGKFIREFMDESHGSVRNIRALPDGSILLSEVDDPTGTVLQRYVDGKHMGHFGEAYRFPDDVAHALLGYRGGSADVGPDGMIYYTQLYPYEIRKFTPAGDLLMRVFRENDFMRAPNVERIGDGVQISGGCGSFGIFVLPDGRFINLIADQATTTFDLFEKDGRLLLTQRQPVPFNPQWLDSKSNVYLFDRDAGAVVRARMTIH